MNNLLRTLGNLWSGSTPEAVKGPEPQHRENPPAVAPDCQGYRNLYYNLQPDCEYAQVVPYATYSPWNMDKEYLKVSEIIKDHSLVDNFRSYELWTLVEQVAKLQGDVLEVGTWRGGTGALMAYQASRCGIPGRIYLCDTFAGVVKSSDKDTYYNDGEHSDVSLASVKQLIFERLRLQNVEILQGMFPEETGHLVEHCKFRLCHIDVDVYQSAKDIFNWVWEKMVPGGVVVYDDYGFQWCDGIRKHVSEIINGPDRIVIHNLNGHAVVVKICS